MTDIVERLETLAKSYPEIDMDDVWEAITQFTRLRSRIAELEGAVKVENEACAVAVENILYSPNGMVAKSAAAAAIRARMNENNSSA